MAHGLMILLPILPACALSGSTDGGCCLALILPRPRRHEAASREPDIHHAVPSENQCRRRSNAIYEGGRSCINGEAVEPRSLSAARASTIHEQRRPDLFLRLAWRRDRRIGLNAAHAGLLS